MTTPLRALIIEDSIDDAFLLEHALRDGGFQLHLLRIESARELANALKQEQWDIVLCDYILPGFNVLEAIDMVKKINQDLPIIIVSGKIDEETAIRAMRAGAHDFITKGNLSRLIPAIHRELKETSMRLQHRLAKIELEEKYRLLAESITDLFFAFDTNLRCTYWNKAAEQFTGIDADKAQGKTFGELFYFIEHTNLESLLHLAYTTRIAHSAPLQIQHDSITSYFDVKFFPTESGVSVIVRDITERKKAESLQKRHKEIEKELLETRELQLLGKLTSGVAHEVRNPLNAISVLVEAIFCEVEGKFDLAEYKNHLQIHVKRLQQLMQDLLDYGKPVEASKLTRISLFSTMKEIISIWENTNKAHRIHLIKNATDPIMIKADPVKIHQVIVNLLDNASQHSEENTNITIDLSSDDVQCSIKVIDNGSGIKPDILAHLFEPFYTTRRKGTGLGLAIVRQIIGVHGGTIELQNNQSPPGCTVEIKLPIA